MELQQDVSLKGKTTMRIGGTAAFFAELKTKDDVQEAVNVAEENGVPLIPLGGGSNTIFADGTINALVVRVTADDIHIDPEPTTDNRQLTTIHAGKNLPALINELAEQGLDLSPLTGILGTVGGAIFGNAGQGPKGIWIDTYVESVDAFIDGQWKTMTKEECEFGYRESVFKSLQSPLIWSTTLRIPKKDPAEIKAEIERLLQQRLDTQPHVKTAGSCFKAVGDTPAWQLIDAAGLRETAAGGVHISEKHANFLINNGEATFQDAVDVVRTIKDEIQDGLEVEMRFVKEDGTTEF